ncbi:mannose-1-phosphate guanylyltransferase/mannose-6-phosphate isomerase [Roseomonas alkaliterrae]|uniref:mannose-1-phosphate guanylyltransferase n=1 Tax=Neoroseomonas alkaliterrae TaxID=1452450 RepID=A0A840XZ27_9PROT|nr:mannose-1-phosphate guanylyltransferase/mannose-6-phosphate isomerase [Neoroseomonas alkaliterrae]MBB5689417.1 mannose-1-phosphate guanylyltransferase/mannose-1-phosphate guanylyltransferase/mannose-6-phosphate isomerase [Neoroseomonas alkaliterrae]MBR0677032.1 mannose-1-phosphate guanylyltransferase/mannose-6-phosphate isomerase [Neoroseomonas alkaliterrae]
MSTTPTDILPVILSGGTGTRLWPLSREGYPKQFWPLASARPMLEETAARAEGPGFLPPTVVCNEAHRFLVAEQLRGRGARIVLEPAGRNSGPAIAAAALLAEEAAPGTVMWIMAADSAVQDVPALHAALARAAAAARAGRIVTFGMKPTAPETGYGYIEAGEALPGLDGVRAIARFVEKPDAARAAEFVAGGRHLWNSGMFVATAATLLAEFERHEPALLAQVRAAVAGAKRDMDFVRLDAAAFAAAPSISIDYAVMERTQHAAVVPAAIGWSDIGSWAALWEISGKDAQGNVAAGPAEIIDSRNCYVRSEGILTGVIGLQDAVVVVTDDAVLAMHRDRAQDVKTLVDALKAKGRKEATEHRRAYRPWGHYEGLIMGDRFQVKKILVRPGAKLSLQKHFHRAEHWVVVSGTAIVRRDAEEILLRENESVYLPLGCVHRMENPGIIPLVLIEVQSGSYLGEDDIVRFEDTYGRA